MNVFLMYGGESHEHEISKLSAKFVCKSLLDAGHTVYLCGVDKKGQWFLQLPVLKKAIQDKTLYEGEMLSLYVPQDVQEAGTLCLFTIPSLGIWHNTYNPQKLPIDIVFPLIHGHCGEDGTLQHIFDVAKIPYVGCDAIASMCCINKYLTKEILRKNNIPVLTDMLVLSSEVLHQNDKIVENIAHTCITSLGTDSIIVKPTDNGSSFGISVAKNSKELKKALIYCAGYGKNILVEPCLQKKREIEVSVIGNNSSNIKSFSPGEIVVHEGNFYDYTLKYHSNGNQISLHVPVELEEDMIRTICEYAEKAYLSLGCQGFARIDFFLYTKETHTTVPNTIVVNEINTIPGFTSISMFPKMIMNEGMSAEMLMDKIIALGLEK